MEPDNRLPERSKEVRAERSPSSPCKEPEMPRPEELERSRLVTRLLETVTPLQEPIFVVAPVPQVLSGWLLGSC